MLQSSPDFGDEHIVIRIDAGGPIELEDLQGSLAALARIYRRRHPSEAADTAPAKLYVTRISSGSIELEIVPLIALLGMPIAFMDAMLIVREFSKWLGTNLRAVADGMVPPAALPREDAADLDIFVSPMKGRRGAKLGVVHARFQKREKSGTAEREIVAEYVFDEGDINRVAVNLQRMEEASVPQAMPGTKLVTEVLMAFQRADKSPAKERGRSDDRVIIQAVTDKPLPVYFPLEAAAIKQRILEQSENPFGMGYIVDVIVQYVDNKPKLYSVIALHDTVPLD